MISGGNLQVVRVIPLSGDLVFNTRICRLVNFLHRMFIL